MAVKLISKTKAKTKVKEAVETAPYAQVVEKMAALKQSLEVLKLTQGEYDSNRKFLLGKIPEDAPDLEPYIFAGIDHKVVFSKAPTNRRFKPGAMKRLHKLVGDDVFYSIAGVPLSSVDKYLAPVEQEELFEVETGSRTCSIKEI